MGSTAGEGATAVADSDRASPRRRAKARTGGRAQAATPAPPTTKRIVAARRKVWTGHGQVELREATADPDVLVASLLDTRLARRAGGEVRGDVDPRRSGEFVVEQGLDGAVVKVSHAWLP
jgi:hypothetical protein